MATRKVKVNRARQVAAMRRLASGGPPSNTPRNSGARAAATAQALRPSPAAVKGAAKYDAAHKSRGGGGGGGGGLSIGSILDAVKGAGGKALEALDVPRAYSVSALKELSDLVHKGTSALGLPDQAAEGAVGIGARGIGGALKLASGDSKGAKELLTKQEKPSDPSFKEFLGQAKRHAGAGELFIQKPGLSSGNAAVDIGLGLTGDVVGDPLTYLTGGVAGTAHAEQTASALEKAGVATEDLNKATIFKKAAAQVARDKSVRNVGSDVLSEAGLGAKGVKFAGNVVPGTEKAYDALTYLPNKLRTSLGDLRDRGTVADLVRGASVPLKKLERLGPEHADVANEARNLREGAASARSLGKGLGGEYSKAYDDILRSAKGQEKNVIPAMGGDTAAQAALGDAYPKMRNLFDKAVSDAKASGVDVGYINDYFPQQLSDELKNLKGGKRRTIGQTIDSWTKQRKYVEGADLPNGVKLKGNPEQVRQQVVDYFREAHGVDPYKTDVSQIGHTYFHGVGNKIARKQTEQRLIDEGVIPARFAEAPTKGQAKQAASLNNEAAGAVKAEGQARGAAARQGVQQADAAAMEQALTDSANTSQSIDNLISGFDRRQQTGTELTQADSAVARAEAEHAAAQAKLGAIEDVRAAGGVPSPTNPNASLSPEAQAVLDEMKAQGLTGGVEEARNARQALPEDVAAAQSQTPWNKLPAEQRQRLGNVEELPGGQTPTLRGDAAQQAQTDIIQQAQSHNLSAADEIAQQRLADAAGQADAAQHGLGEIHPQYATTLQDNTVQNLRTDLEQAQAWYQRKYPRIEKGQEASIAKGRSMKMDRLINLAEKQPNTKAGIEARRELAQLNKRLGKAPDEIAGSVDLTHTAGGAAAKRADAAAKQRGFNTVDEWVADSRQKVADAEGGNLQAETLDQVTGKPNMPDVNMTQQVDRQAIEQATSVERVLGKYGFSAQDVTPKALKLAQDDAVRKLDALDAAKVNANELRSRLAEAQSKVISAKGVVDSSLPPVPEGHVRLYRGEMAYEDNVKTGLHTPAGARGRWYTSDPEMARVYSHLTPTGNPLDDVLHATRPDGPIYYVDVPQELAAQTERNGWQHLLPGDAAERRLPANAQAATKAAELRTTQSRHLELAASTDDIVQSHLHSLASEHAAAEATAVEEHKKWLNALEGQRALATEPGRRAFSDAMKGGFRQYVQDYPDLALDPEVQQAYNKMSEAFAPGNPNGFVRYYDRALNWIKGWQIATPGFVSRNVQGGIWSNFLADVDLRAHEEWLRLHFADPEISPRLGSEARFEKVLGSIAKRRGVEPDKVRQVWQDVHRFAHQGQSAMEFVSGGKDVALHSKVNPFSSSNLYVRGVRDVNQFAEDFLRGSMGLDTMLKGGTAEDAVQLINKYHFDYEDLSKFEKGLKRIIPFYTWNRHNLPLQWEQMVRQPGKFNKYTQFKNEMEQHSSPDAYLPGYFAEGGAIRLPAEQGGGHVYIVPDAPIKDVINPPTDASDLGSLVTPYIKTPIEYYMGQQVFKQIPLDDKLKQSPATWGPVMPALGAVGLAKKQGNDWYMRGKDAYLVEQFFPFLGRARRLAPSEPQYQQRVLSTWVSTLVGGGLRTNTKTEQNMEKVSRLYREADRLASDATTDKQRIYAARKRKDAGRIYAKLFK